MPRITKTKENPYGLSLKQLLTIKDVVSDVEQGIGFSLVKSTRKFYNAKNGNVVRQIVHQNITKHNFKEALMAELTSEGVTGGDSKVTYVMSQGLDATKPTEHGEAIDYLTRLKYIQEIFKICGIY